MLGNPVVSLSISLELVHSLHNSRHGSVASPSLWRCGPREGRGARLSPLPTTPHSPASSLISLTCVINTLAPPPASLARALGSLPRRRFLFEFFFCSLFLLSCFLVSAVVGFIWCVFFSLFSLLSVISVLIFVLRFVLLLLAF